MTRAPACLVALLICLGFLPSGSAVAQTERLLGAEGGNGTDKSLVVLDPATGAVTNTIGPMGFTVTGLAVDPADGVIYGSTGAEEIPAGSLITIDRDTGAGTLIGELANGDPAADITFREGTLFGWIQAAPRYLATIDKATGAATSVGASGLSSGAGSGLAASSDGVLYYTGSNDNGLLRTVDSATGAVAEGPMLDGECGAPIRALAFNAAGTLYGVRKGGGTTGNCATDTMLITIDPASGHIEDVGETLSALDGIVFDSFQPPPPPPPPPPPADTDGDGVPDASDACPTTFAQTPNGCPAPLPVPEIGEMVVTAVVSGEVTVALPGSPRRFVPLSQVSEIPVGSIIDARRGAVRITSARDSAGRTQSGVFSGGIFQVRQSSKRSARGLTTLVLRGGNFNRCGSGRSASAAGLSRRAIRRLRANTRGRFRTSGRNSSATVRGTRWETIDRCDGTLTKVQRGSVVVRDFRRRKNVIVKAGKSYLARARR
jgi:hypothetical protein